MSKSENNKEVKPGCVKTLAELAAIAGVNRRNVSDWKKRDGFPIEPDGTYNVWKIAEWRCKTFDLRNKPEKEAEDVDIVYWKIQGFIGDARQSVADAVIKELRAQEVSGELVRRDSVKRFISRALGIVRQRLEAQPAENSMIFPAEIRSDAVAEWKRMNKLILRQLSNTLVNIFEDE
ncbi:MAG: hypothetical protein KDA77_00225 [Planctomycetaceae bacterium]|nr:hypothetical protein [Planctomycetaceae bacterium]